MIFRKMEWSDIPSGLSLCRSAGWNQLHRDWEMFLTLHPDGARVCVDEEGKVVGTVATIRYGDRLAWIGMVLVDPANRRKGIGLRLLENALEMLMDVDNIKLDATPAGRQVYVKLGFQDEYGLSRMVAGSWSSEHLTPSTATPLMSEDLEDVRPIDQGVFGADRISLLRWMLEGAPELAFKVTSGDGLLGYCFGRPGYNYTHIGPVVAANAEVVKDLVTAALRGCGDKPVILDVPHGDEIWAKWLSSVGFTELRPFIRMYKGSNVDGHRDSLKQYVILGPEFG